MRFGAVIVCAVYGCQLSTSSGTSRLAIYRMHIKNMCVQWNNEARQSKRKTENNKNNGKKSRKKKKKIQKQQQQRRAASKSLSTRSSSGAQSYLDFHRVNTQSRASQSRIIATVSSVIDRPNQNDMENVKQANKRGKAGDDDATTLWHL